MAKLNKKQTLSEAQKEPTDEQLQGNQHDKIIKESIEETMSFLLKIFANIDVAKSENLPTEIQQTQERKPDFLKLITDTSGVESIGHLEFHVKDEADITFRAFETCAMMKRKKPHLDMFQIIAYMGEKPAKKILSELSGSQFSYKVKVIQFIKTPVEVFLQAESAAEVLLGILSDFGDKPPEEIIPQLVEKVIKHSKTDLERLKFLKHLQIFSKLRNFEPLINHIMATVIAHFGLKDEDDILYKRGAAAERANSEIEAQKREIEAQKREIEAQRHLEQQQRFIVIRLLDAGILTEAEMIQEYEVTAAFIETVKKDIMAAPKKIDRLKKTFNTQQIAQQLRLPIKWVEKYLQQT